MKSTITRYPIDPQRPIIVKNHPTQFAPVDYREEQKPEPEEARDWIPPEGLKDKALPEPEVLTEEQEKVHEEILTQSQRKLETVEDLYEAINDLYENMGSFKTHSFVLGTATVRAEIFTSGGPRQEGSLHEIDAYYPTEQEAVQALWGLMCMLKVNPDILLTEEAKQDNVGMPNFKATKIYWRLKPRLETTPNNLYAVRMRAAFL